MTINESRIADIKDQIKSIRLAINLLIREEKKLQEELADREATR